MTKERIAAQAGAASAASAPIGDSGNVLSRSAPTLEVTLVGEMEPRWNPERVTLCALGR